MSSTSALHAEFKKVFAKKSDTIFYCFAPGRVNIIGEYVDFCGGSVLPAALNHGTYAMAALNGSDQLRLRSAGQSEEVDVELSLMKFDAAHAWANYVKGVFKEYLDLGFELLGMDIYYNGDLPIQSGLSSSASLEVCTALLIQEVLQQSSVTLLESAMPSKKVLDKREIALLSQRAENNFMRVNCGIMDQSAIVYGQENQATLINCESVTVEYTPLNLGEHTIVIVNTNKARALEHSSYNQRRLETEQALAHLQIKSLNGLGIEQLSQKLIVLEGAAIDENIKMRGQHILSEQIRVYQSSNALKRGEIQTLGRLLKESHQSLRDAYQVSCEELDVLVDISLQHEGVLGARMTGAGFGGCILCLIETKSIESYKEMIALKYLETCARQAAVYEMDLGVSPIIKTLHY